MSAATIVFMDIVGFSRKPTSEQKRLVEALTDEVVHGLRTLLNPPFQTPEVVALPTGDGMALTFLHNPIQRWSLATIVTLIHHLQQWAWDQTRETSHVALRIGLHVGTVEIITDVNGHPNVCGDTINYAQRVMDAANPRQVLLSEAAYREYIGAEYPQYSNEQMAGETSIRTEGPIQVFAKYALQIPVYKMVCTHPHSKMVDGEEVLHWENKDPVMKDHLLIALTPLPKEIAGSFAERLQKAQAIALVQLGGERLLKRLQDEELQLSPQLKRFWVFMPDPATYGTFAMGQQYISADDLHRSIAQWTEYIQRLHARTPSTQIKLGLYQVPPFWGGSFLDWHRSGGTIHISPYMWNCAADACPGYDLLWLGGKPSAVYDAYVGALDWLHDHVPNRLSAASA